MGKKAVDVVSDGNEELVVFNKQSIFKVVIELLMTF
jgi:hypothetical protein